MNADNIPKFSTGIKEFDEILNGGFLPQSTNLLRGGPGVGKTTFGIHFLLAGVAKGESTLFITLGEPVANIKKNAGLLGLTVDNISFLDLSPDPEYFSKVESYDIFTPAEVEREPTTHLIVEAIEKIKPSRVFLDAMTEFKFLSTDNFQFRKQVLSFLHYLQENKATVLFTTEHSNLAPDDDLQFIADTVINLKGNRHGSYLEVVKLRGSDFMKGMHGFKIRHGGINVFPNVMPSPNMLEIPDKKYSLGIDAIDELLGGGISAATINLISGPSGVGKTTFAMQIVNSLGSMHLSTDYYTFEEEVDMILRRCRNINIDAGRLIDKGLLHINKMEPLLYSADEFLHMVSKHASERKVSLVVIDSTAGFKLSLKGQDIVEKMHALCKHLQSLGIITFLLSEVGNITGDFKITEEQISYLADNIIFIRYLEINGMLRKAIGVLKKRLSDFEKTLREFEITSNGIVVGKPLVNLRGILSGVPEWV